jgi:hypothetical protein
MWSSAVSSLPDSDSCVEEKRKRSDSSLLMHIVSLLNSHCSRDMKEKHSVEQEPKRAVQVMKHLLETSHSDTNLKEACRLYTHVILGFSLWRA